MSAHEAFVTLATNDEYAVGALVLAQALRNVNTKKHLVCMIANTVSSSMRSVLGAAFDHLEVVDVLDSRDTVNLGLLQRPELGVTFTKIHCWRLTQYTKAVFLDADTMVVENIDDLFLHEELSAAPDPGWPDCFNSGVFVYKPALSTYTRILDFALSKGSFDGGDQGLLNMFFSEWATRDASHRLSFLYNCVCQAFYSYQPAFQHFKDKVKVIHFIGPVKPWHHDFDISTGTVIPREGTGFQYDFLQSWWKVFATQVKPTIHPGMEGLAGRLVNLQISFVKDQGSCTAEEGVAGGQFAWERGQIDYMGADSFSNIQSRIDSQLEKQSKK